MAALNVPEGCPLAPREFEILALLCDGKTYKQAAFALGIQHSTVKALSQRARKRLGVPNVGAAVALMVRSGWWGWPTTPPATVPPIGHRPEAELFLKAYLAEFDRWVAGRWSDQQPRDGMDIALRGALNAVNTPRRHYRGRGDPIRDILEHVAADTLWPAL